ncbi:phosphatidylserine lipase ABHD16A-like [Homalodisca vitripennis]|nr:phosphatidylserine lipase ABHD16A-like [Homalodisca vitripennis]
MQRQEAPLFPSSFGASMDPSQKCQMLLYIASTYLTDFASTHCTPLPPSIFHMPQLISTT